LKLHELGRLQRANNLHQRRLALDKIAVRGRRQHSLSSRDKVLLGRSREVLGAVRRSGRLGGLGGGGASPGISNYFLGLGGVVTSVGLDGRGGARGVVGSKLLDLGGLGIDNLGDVVELLVDDFLVVDVDQGCEVDARDTDQGEAPEGNELDEEVGEQRDEEGSDSDSDILGVEDSLELNDEEVDELLDILERSLKVSLWIV